MSHDQLSLEEGALTEASKSSYLVLGKEGGGETHAIDRAALRVVDHVDLSM